MDNVRRLNKTLTTLINSVMKVEEAVMKQSAAADLSITEIHTLEAIGDGKPKTMTHVAAELKINISTLTAAINKLVAKGYVNRFRIAEDRRMVMLELTGAGTKAVREHEEFHMAMAEDSLARLSPAEASKFIESLENVNQFMLMRKANPSPEREIRITPDMIYQGGMGIGVSMGRLAAAVAICGGTGVISATEPGYSEKDYKTNPVEANKRALERNIKGAIETVQKAGGKGVIGINIPCTSDHYEEYVITAIEAGAQAVISGGGVPTALPGVCRDKEVKLIPVISSARAASVIIRNWAKKHNRAPDALIFEGPLAGGYLGFKEDKIDAAMENFYASIAEIKAEIEGFPGCKLIAGGGIYDLRDAQKAIACGADGVQLGSRFVTTVECDAHENFKQAYIGSGESDIGIVLNPAGMSCRVLMNKFAKKVQKDPEFLKGRVTEALIKAANGDTENGLVFCGGKAYKAVKIETVVDVFKELTS